MRYRFNFLFVGVALQAALQILALQLFATSATCAQRTPVDSRAALSNPAISVDESATRIDLTSSSAAITLKLANSTHAAIPAHIKLELVSSKNVVTAAADRDVRLTSGASRIKFEISAASQFNPAGDTSDLLWYRLRYTITPADSTISTASGIQAAGPVMSGLFELTATAPEFFFEGQSYAVHILAAHPSTKKPVAGVTLEAAVDLSDDGAKPLVSRTVVTDSHGLATLHLTLPERITKEISITVTGKRAGISASTNSTIPFTGNKWLAISTDKSLYQPGQTLHIRSLMYGRHHQAQPDQAVTFKISGPGDALVFRADSITSKFGIASADWEIPENLRLGRYGVSVYESNGRENGGVSHHTSVEIQRYDLPNFVVSTKPDRDFYLPHQDASVEVAANYLFGRPVPRGHVRVVQEADREWNFLQQKFDVKEGQSAEGDTDSRGIFVAKLDLSPAHKDLEDSGYWQYRDISFTSYFTDPSSGRTEHRRFDLRVTKGAIHIYTVPAFRNFLRTEPFDFFLSADYADGRPAECDIDIFWTPDSDPYRNGRSKNFSEQHLLRVHTNRLGMVKISALKFPLPADHDSVDLIFRAIDRKGATGTSSQSWELYSESWLHLATSKSIYRHGEPVDLEVSSDVSSLAVFVDAMSLGQVIASKEIRMSGKTAQVEFEPDQKFDGRIEFLARALRGSSATENSFRDPSPSGAHSVYFSKNRRLQMDVHLEKTVYRPGETAEANIRVSTPAGAGVASDIGLVVVDQAVEAREKSSGEIEDTPGFNGILNSWGDDEGISGVTTLDLDNLDLSKPIPEEISLACEFMLASNQPPDWAMFDNDEESRTLNRIYESELQLAMFPIRDALARRYNSTGVYPDNESELKTQLAEAGIDFDAFRDPWGAPFHARYSFSRDDRVLEIVSSGPDKQFNTADDFVAQTLSWKYFAKYAAQIRAAAIAYNDRTGNFIRDLGTLEAELRTNGIPWDTLRDPWGNPYRASFGNFKADITISIESPGRDHSFNTPEKRSWDDFEVANIALDLFAVGHKQIDAALQKYFDDAHQLPQSLEEFRQALSSAGIAWDSFRDAWNHPYYARFSRKSVYGDQISFQSYELHQRDAYNSKSVPVTQGVDTVDIWSVGEDGKEDTRDDFIVASFTRLATEQSAAQVSPKPATSKQVLSGANGAISGQVLDQAHAAIGNATAVATNNATAEQFTAATDEVGRYLISSLPPGLYLLAFQRDGFQTARISDVPVQSANTTYIDVMLRVGAVSMTVEVVSTAGAQLQTQSEAFADPFATKARLPKFSQQPASTPHLREYFPETLVWRPEIITDKNGRATLKFPLADTITSWKLSAIASTIDGEVGAKDKEIRVFQPFFVEHDPPQFLTAGDEIALPVVLRNYLDRPLNVNVEMKSSPWFSMLGPSKISATISRNDFARGVFRFSASTAIKNGAQEVDAAGAGVSDAISRKITVRPNGEGKSESWSEILSDRATVNFEIPANTIAGSIDARVKIYPNLEAHVLESIEQIMERPYGCAEQTISSAYPGILFLKYAKGTTQENSPAFARAQHFAQLGYDRLLSYRTADGAISYWGRGDADPALSAYALKFLNDAREFIAVDPAVTRALLLWLVHNVDPLSAPPAVAHSASSRVADTTMLTAYAARIVTEFALANETSSGDPELAQIARQVLPHWFQDLDRSFEASTDPYAIASYTLASYDAGNLRAASAGLQKLIAMEHHEGNTSYWAAERNTPFYGWGRAGRIETTALVLRALGRGEKTTESEALISRGLLFLLRNQDSFGIWYSTQATILVLDTMASLTTTGIDSSAAGATNSTVEIFVDGKQLASLTLPPAGETSAPLESDLSQFLTAGAHRLEIRNASGAQRASIQLVTNYYVPWDGTKLATDQHAEDKTSGAVRLSVHFDRDSAAIGDEIRCDVDAERIGFRGYGMMLAEIGLPPGADVDSDSLEHAMANSGWDINHYDVLPDRVVLYLWPHAGGTKFSFNFKPRFALHALATPSLIYDYYNPDARATVQPAHFIIH